MHDPLCLADAIQPDLIDWQPAYVDVELTSTLTLGETVAHFERSPLTFRHAYLLRHINHHVAYIDNSYSGITQRNRSWSSIRYGAEDLF